MLGVSRLGQKIKPYAGKGKIINKKVHHLASKNHNRRNAYDRPK
jgi:hypothetical protein